VKQNELVLPAGAKHSKKRVGRGSGSGHGGTACRGNKGQKSRSGFKMRPGFEGGQNPLTKRLPELRGFNNIFRKEYSTLNVARLNCFESDSEVTPQRLLDQGLVRSLKYPIKILGDGVVEKALIVKANKFTQSAKNKIEAAGGKVEEI
jgi:large subunit ribosomal protein L15